MGWMRVVAGVVIGAGLGYGWYRVVGCGTGACPITANPWTSAAYGGVVGLLMSSSG